MPQSMWPTIFKKLGLPEGKPVLDDAGYFADEERYGRTEFDDEDDDL